MEDREISNEEGLEIIQGMIDLAKNKINDYGFHFILWGVLVMASSLTQYFMLASGITDPHWVWGIMSLIGGPIAIIYEFRKSKRGTVQSKFDKIYGYLWMGFGITMAIAIWVSVMNHINPIAFILSLVGFATFVTGALQRFTPLIAGAVVFWVSAAICPTLGESHQLLINAGAIFLGYIVPGMLLWNKNKKRV